MEEEVEEEEVVGVDIALHGIHGVHHQPCEHIQEDGRTQLKAVLQAGGGGCQWKDIIL